MRIGIDATPLLGTRTGIGTYTAALLTALARSDSPEELVATAFTWRGRHDLSAALPPGVGQVGRPVPARVLRALWSNGEQPPLEWLTGAVDVFHGTNFVLPPLRRAAGVLTVHDLAYLRFPDTVAPASARYRRLVPLGLRRAAVVCTPSRAVADQVIDAYAVPPDRVRVTPLGVDPSWSHAEPPRAGALAAAGIPGDYLLAVGTLEPRKNLRSLITAYTQLVAAGVQVPALVIVGGSGWGDRLERGVIPPERLVFTGHLPTDRLRSLVAGARLLVFPSLDEGFGLPPLEALACAVPVLAADLPVTREVLGDQAVFVDARCPAALADGIERALDTPAGTPDTRRAHAARFTWQRCAEATYAAYELAVQR